VLSSAPGRAPRTVIGTPHEAIDIVAAPYEYVFDVDPAILAARLSGTLAAEHALAALGRGATYLTGSRAVADAALACFAVEDLLPLRINQIKQYLDAHNIGQLEIKKRGVDIDPEALRRQLKPTGDSSATLLICTIGGSPAVIVAQRYRAE
jgi:hypothetical protein